MHTSSLTTGVDNFTGLAGNDSFVASYDSTIDAGDVVNGGEGTDTMTIRASAAMSGAAMPELVGIENLIITNTAAALAHTGLSTFAPNATSITLRGAQDYDIAGTAYSTQVLTLAGTTGDLTLDGVGTAASLKLDGTSGELDVSTATTLNLEILSASTVADIANQSLTTLNISGAGAFTLEDASTEGFTSIDASENTAGVTLELVDGTATSVTGSAAADIIDTTGAIDNDGDDTAIDGGDGADTLKIDTNITDGSAITNIENVMLTASGLTYEMEADGATGIWIGTPGADNGAANNDTAAITGYDGSAALYIIDANLADATEAETINLDVGVATDYTDETTVNIQTSKTGTQRFIVADIDINDEAGGDNIDSFIVNVSGTRAVTISNIDLDQHGSTPTLAVNSSVSLIVSDVDFATTTAGDDLGNTITFAGSTGAITYAMGDSAYSADSDDVIIGGTGSTDTVSMDVADDDLSVTMSGFETIQILDSNDGSVDFENISGYTTIAADDISTDNIALTNVLSGTTIAITDEGDEQITVNTSAAGSLSVTFADADEYDGGDALVFGTSVNTVNFVIDEDSADVDLITATFGSAASMTVNLTGDDSTDDTLVADFTFAATASSIVINSAVDASFSTDGDTLDDDVTVDFSGSTGAITYTIDEADLALADSTFKGGSGTTDTLTVDMAATTNAATVEGFETLNITDTNVATIDLSDFTGLSTVAIVATTDAATINSADTVDIIKVTDGGANAITIDGSVATGAGLSATIQAVDDLGNTTLVVTDIENVTIDLNAAQTAIDVTLSDDQVDTVYITSDAAEDSTAAASSWAGAEVLDLSGVLGDLDLTDVTLADDVDITLGAGNDTMTIVLATGARQTITFGADVADGEQVSISGLTVGIGVNTDVLDVSALGVASLDDLTIEDVSLDNTDAAAADSIKITSTLFDGEIYIVGTDAANVLSADLAVTNFAFA